MKTLLDTVASAPNPKLLFAAGERFVTAGQIRKTALGILDELGNEPLVFIHTLSASLFLAGLLAAAMKGVPVSFPAHLQPQYLREIGADRHVVLTDDKTVEAPTIPVEVASDDAPAFATPNDLSMVFYTSGVTGVPKQITKSIAQLDREAWVLEQVWGAHAGRVSATVSHQHIYGMLFRIFWPVVSGRISEDRAAEYWEQLARTLSPGATVVSSPAHLMRLPPFSLSATSAPAQVFSSGAPLPYGAAQESLSKFGSLPIEVLGSTETGGIGWRQQTRSDAPWTPLPSVQIDVDAAGALRVRSPFAGDEVVATGDVIQQSEAQFWLLGRADRVAKIDGKRISLDRVEEALRGLPIVAAVAVVDLPSFKGALGAIVELNDDGIAALEKQGAFRLSRTLRGQLVEHLEPSERPKHWRFRRIPLNPQGKRVAALLRAQFDEDNDKSLGVGTVLLLEAAKAQLTIELPNELVWFKGHFPDEPVLPGIAQVHLAVRWADRLWNWTPSSACLTRLKFRHIVRPGTTLTLSLGRDVTTGRLSFAYRAGELAISDGVIGGGP